MLSSDAGCLSHPKGTDTGTEATESQDEATVHKTTLSGRKRSHEESQGEDEQSSGSLQSGSAKERKGSVVWKLQKISADDDLTRTFLGYLQEVFGTTGKGTGQKPQLPETLRRNIMDADLTSEEDCSHLVQGVVDAMRDGTVKETTVRNIIRKSKIDLKS